MGTPQALVDEQGNLVWQGEFDPYGNRVTIKNPEQRYQPIRMQGQHYDEESGLHYNRHRYYDPMQGKYLTQDPIGLQGGMNIYIYPDNPLAFVDPLGLAYFAKRPLGSLPWLGLFSNNPLDGYFNTEISHEQLFFGDGLLPSNIGFMGDGNLQEETGKILNSYHNMPQKYEDDLMRQAVKNIGPLKEYKLFGSNCQTWADKVKDEYIRLVKVRGGEK